MAGSFSITASSDAWRSQEDTGAFLELLSRLKAGAAASEEERAAADLFSWASELVVARAPGRMDVMGAPHRACLSRSSWRCAVAPHAPRRR